jgi:EAL domain-containing protein (putative c-di-GMP-specific phosphodiesterase class I)
MEQFYDQQSGAENSDTIRAMFTLGASLGKQVIVEGIETEDQLASLKTFDCTHGQGFLLAVPLTARQASALLTSPFLGTPVQTSEAVPVAAYLPFASRLQTPSLVRIH